MMLRRAFANRFALLALALAAQAFAALPAEAVTGKLRIEVAGQKRSAVVVEPERLKRVPRTTIIVLHGGSNSTGKRIQASLGLDESVRSAGIALVYPDALERRWNITGDAGSDDPAFLRALAARLVSDGVADRQRIYLIGVSNGGMLALRVACQQGDYLAGVGALIAGLPAKLQAGCKPPPMSLMLLAGTADPLVPYQGGAVNLVNFKEDVLPAQTTLNLFATADSCSAQVNLHEVPDRDPTDGSRVIIERPIGCKHFVEFVRVEGGGHTLPGQPVRADRGQIVGAQNRDININRLIAEFVRRAAH
jgi:polyhydroxybutyrate depolymerase